ncbi:tRNA lysidine(34) synthetase TilS [Nocardioides dilutus]
MSLHPSIAAVRSGVRHALGELDPHSPQQPTVMVACSGGADSLALLSAAIFEGHGARRGGGRSGGLDVRVIGITVDHGLQEGAAEHAARVVAQMAALGVDETASARVTVESGGRGTEAAAREARYSVLDQMAEHFGAALVLLGHTRDDQAETVLLGLTRGSGGRALAGMRRSFGLYRRPLLDVGRTETVTACQVEGLDYWDDPHNADPAYTRSRVRHRVLPVLEEELGPGVAATLARTADQLREDTELLDGLAAAAYDDVRTTGGLDAVRLAPQPSALAHRVLRLAALDAGALGGELFRVHVLALAELLGPQPRPGEVQLPGLVSAVRDGDLLTFRRTAVPG